MVEKHVVVFCLFFCFSFCFVFVFEQQNVIYFILENEGERRAIFVNCETGTIFSNDE